MAFPKMSKFGVVLNIDGEDGNVWFGVIKPDLGGWKKCDFNNVIVSNVLNCPTVPLLRFSVAFECLLRDVPGGSTFQRRGHIEDVEAARPSSLPLWCGIGVLQRRTRRLLTRECQCAT